MARQAYRYSFTVSGRGEFPYDMLRFDSCYPASEGESGKMANPMSLTGEGKREVRMRRIAGTDWFGPTVARWQSFGWDVDEASITKERYEI